MIPFWKKTDKHSKPQSAQKRRQNAKPAVPRTAQQSIPMQRMFEDGTCRVKPNYYTRTIQYQDINYQLAQQEDKTAIFEEWCSFLNFFDSSIKFELSFVNMATDSTEFEKSIRIPFQKDGFDDVRAEYSQMLRQQLAKGNNGLTKTKFITFGVEGESMAQVKPRLDHIQNDLLNNFHRLGVQAKPLNGVQRLKLMHDMFNMDGASKFHFDWKDLVKSGLSVKDAIAPTAFAFKNSRTFQMGGIFCAASFLSITASDISDQLLKDFLDMDSSQIVTMHIQSDAQSRAIKTVKRTITELDRSKIEEQKKAIRAGYDIDIIPSDLATYGRDAKALLNELQSQNERMFLVTFLVLNTGRHLEIRVMPYTHKQLLMVARDVTQMHQLEGARRNFFANVSHELRTPLTVLQGYLEMMDEQPLEGAVREKALHTMREQTQRMEGLVKQLLTLSKIEAAPTQLLNEKVDVPMMLRVVEREAQTLSQKKQTFTFEIDNDLKVSGNEDQLRSAISNLVYNAVNHTPEGTHITVRWQRVPHGAEFSVEDNGPGIAPEHIPRLTERFYRVDKARSRQTGGSGLGLAIVKHAVNHHESRLNIDSTVGKGTRFSFVLPERLIAKNSN